MIYDIYLLQLGFHPVVVVARLEQKQERNNTTGETTHKTIQTQYKYTKYKTKIQNKHKSNIKKISRVIRK
jgi:hypothetical protein